VESVTTPTTRSVHGTSSTAIPGRMGWSGDPAQSKVIHASPSAPTITPCVKSQLLLS
jgi:hypothetical protein